MSTSYAPYYYDLPASRIAQRPVHPYDTAKMLCVNRRSGVIEDRSFADLPIFLQQNDTLVINNTAVVPARLFGKIGDQGAQVELLTVEDLGGGKWICLGRPLKRLKPGTRLTFSARLSAYVIGRCDNSKVIVEFSSEGCTDLNTSIFEHGSIPIPPYIRDGNADEEDLTDYQSMFATVQGSIAAPTASLHFTRRLIDKIEDKGVKMLRLTLHLGTASVMPVSRQGGDLRAPEPERLIYSTQALDVIRSRRAGAGRVIAVGTSMARALESIVRTEAHTADSPTSTNLFITPGHEFLALDAMITNFHQPGTTHLLLVEALLGRELLSKAYQHALTAGYRFLSYGDGMFIY